MCDIHQNLVQSHMETINYDKLKNETNVYPLVVDEELWCFKQNSIINLKLKLGLDIIISSGHLHWVNDLQVTLMR